MRRRLRLRLRPLRALAPATATTTALSALLLLLLPSSAQAQTTEFKPVGVRFIQKRTTTVFPGLDASASTLAAGGVSSAARGDPAASIPREAPGARDWLDAAGRERAERAAAVVADALRLAQRGGDNNATSSTVAALAAAGLDSRDYGAAAAAATTRNATAATRAASVRRAWNAINAYDQASAVGNPVPYSYDPPDQAFAVSSRYALAGVNTATRVYEPKTGQPLSPTIDYTVLMGLPPLWGTSPKRPPDAPCGDAVVDPTALYDPELRRWFQIIARIGQDPKSCEETGDYWLEVAVSSTASPIGAWSVYSLYASNNGQQGSPLVDGCQVEKGGCFADFPRAQLDPNVLVITTNAFSASAFVGAGVFVLDKFALARGSDQVALAEFSLVTAGGWDSNARLQSISPQYAPPRKLPRPSSPWSRYNNNNNRKHHPHHHKKKKDGGGGGPPAWKEPFLLLSHSLDDPYRLIRFALTGTRAVKAARTPAGLEALSAALTITASPIALPAEPPIIEPSLFYRVAKQPSVGNYPLGQSLGLSPGFIGASPSRVLSSTVADGRHLGVFTTLAQQEDGFRYNAVYLAQLDAKTGSVLKVDVISDLGGHLTWPAVALDRNGRGAVVAIASSSELYMSAAAFPIASDGSLGGRLLAIEGKGLLDTFTTYSLRPRAGDYSVVVVEADSGLLWGAAEVVSEMSCDLAAWNLDKTCEGTRAASANWYSGVFALKL